ncbi:hypothetical protein ZOSMA_246G00370 [Zostera marina]|uniref:Uncharacterized protein n=1 Tax=Zostera marina TaxID=29655 RepID=A0A0K9PJ35_ZOSMR|nr:hypothetical protein ZOSMA_246G00370 [Zostera marina]
MSIFYILLEGTKYSTNFDSSLILKSWRFYI